MPTKSVTLAAGLIVGLSNAVGAEPNPRITGATPAVYSSAADAPNTPADPKERLRFSAETVHRDKLVIDKRPPLGANAEKPARAQPAADSACTVESKPHMGSGIVIGVCEGGYQKMLGADLQEIICLKDECNPEGPVPAIVESFYRLDDKGLPRVYTSLEGTEISGGQLFQDLFYNDGRYDACTNYFVKDATEADRLQTIQTKLGAHMTFSGPAPDPRAGHQLQMCRTLRS